MFRMPFSYATQATRSALRARVSSSGDEGPRNWATVGFPCWAASGMVRSKHAVRTAEVRLTRRIEIYPVGLGALEKWRAPPPFATLGTVRGPRARATRQVGSISP